MRGWTVVFISLLVAGCSKAAHQSYADEKTNATLVAPGRLSKPGTNFASAAPAVSAPMLAYKYGYGIEAPPSQIKPLIAKHEGACVAAGTAICQETGSTIEATGKDSIEATLSLRAAPAWVTKFRASLAEDAKSAGGRVVNATVSSDDLSREIVDEEATVRAKTALRDRLQSILQSRPGKTSDLIEVETALSNVQSELDASNSELAVARERVVTSVITINYSSASVFTPEGTWSPLASAIKSFVGEVVVGLAVMVHVLAVLLPWIVVIGIGVWIIIRRRSREKKPRRRRADQSSPPEG
ncbi:MAG: DUF4349 domain-containing protein [Caulobacteraceae bacterium]